MGTQNYVPLIAGSAIPDAGSVCWPTGLRRTANRLRWFDRLAALPPNFDLNTIARKFRVAKPTVHRWVKCFGYRLHDPRRRAGPAGIWDDVKWGLMDAQIARELGVCRERVRQVRKQRGLPPSTGRPQKPLPPLVTGPAVRLRKTG